MADASGLDALRSIVGHPHVLDDPEVTASYRTDWTARWVGTCRAVVRPADTSEVAAVVRWCSSNGVHIVPQGGNTGLVGGAVPSAGDVVLSTLRLSSIGEVDDRSGQVTAGAGATVAAVEAAARAAGWRYGVDFAARESATIGGSVATNAGGHHVVRHGMTRRQVIGLEVVLADGSVVSHLGGLVKDNTGYDLGALMCGSEGTLGVITSARLALVPDAGERAVALVGFDSVDAAVAAIGPLRRAIPELEALELMFADGIASVAEVIGASPPLGDVAVMLLVEVAGGHDPIAVLGDAVGRLDGVVAVAVADDATRRADLWRWRDAHTETISRVGTTPPHKLDVTLPLPRLARFIAEVRSLVATVAPEARLWLFGHAGDGNIHVNITGLAPDDESVVAAVLELVASMGGSISAEHGIGRAKRQWLHLNRSPAEIAAFRSIKRALDPTATFNPRVLLPEIEATSEGVERS
ncbi:MAG: FAD-binding oxidoreductase [Acidimicrobiia bacterium]|nr:FAD-binding oxidoreductase [Acidimicrobiia bacterium]